MNHKEIKNCNTSHTILTSTEGCNIDIDDLDEEIAKKLKGDTIGDTLYSQSFVLKTLLQFSDLKWDNQVEEDLCFLWDMTMEKDVCIFLLEMSYPTLACNAVINYSDNNRLIEIVIGILANIFCCGCENSMTTDQFMIILTTIDSDDFLILIQLMRFLTASLENNTHLISLVDQEFMNKICFILKNSVNSDLLMKTLNTVIKLSTDFRINEDLVGYSFSESVLICFQTLTKSENNDFELDTTEKKLSVRYFLEVLTNICSYIERFKKTSLLLDIRKESNLFINEFIKILKFFSHEENLLPISDEIIFFISAISYIFINLTLSYIPEVFVFVTKMLYITVDIKDEIKDFFESALELECYLMSCTQPQEIRKALKCLPRNKVKKVMNEINQNYSKFDCSSNNLSLNINQFI